MKLHLMSDLHLDHRSDKGAAFLKSIDPEEATVCVLAGDITTGRFADDIVKIIDVLKAKYQHLILIPGNHEYYGAGYERVWDIYNRQIDCDQLHVLHSSSITIEGKRIVGDTMWFRYDPLNFRYKHQVNDFMHIPVFDKWVYRENVLCEEYLNNHLHSDDIVVTHHLPAPQSVDDRYKGDQSNRFFLCDMTKLILERKPALWLHGHTHTPADYMLGDTRVVCNPMGYPRERPGTYKPKLIEV